ncbi:MAG: hypothetical protein AB7E49_00250 [Campylobacterales bacterium]
MRTLFWVVPVVVLLIGCGTKEPLIAEGEQALKGIPFDAPRWVENPVVEGKLAASGGSPQVTGGLRFQQIEAAGRAKEALRNQIEIRSAQAAQAVLAMLMPEPASVVEVAQTSRMLGLMVGAQAAKEFKREEIWWSPSREHYVLFTIDRDLAKSLTAESIRLMIRSDETYWERFVLAGDPQMIESAVEQAFLP